MVERRKKKRAEKKKIKGGPKNWTLKKYLNSEHHACHKKKTPCKYMVYCGLFIKKIKKSFFFLCAIFCL